MTQETTILAIETSCDETAAAVIKNGRHILSNVVASQQSIHAKYGGVFPEVASRRHIEVIQPIVSEALEQAETTLDECDLIAVTRGPGLVGSLLVGVNMAKGLALASDKPLLGVNHIEGHIYAQWLTAAAPDIRFPILILVVSGGHTELYLMTSHCTYKHLGGTIDDAAGEAFDKVGRLLDLPYPGGPAIDKIAKRGNANAYQFPRALMKPKSGYDFSFSGLKTAVLRETRKFDADRMPVADMAASFQTAVVDVLIEKAKQAAEEYKVTAVHLAGGVSANSQLREEIGQRMPVTVRYPPLPLCI
ncbi:MAG: tRNA (adenosine(37)-N6)-threonylcarbamoyltransferase complex transferase subunit TsaD, partial [Sphaerospermopsis sp. SIO1G2]|nr:tRNA (adenosine(37)-N6)-threonylcarbamoyltransferase complex transferase subunit TsaD [Sphaerospermopsis sp. SIO1G2]